MRVPYFLVAIQRCSAYELNRAQSLFCSFVSPQATREEFPKKAVCDLMEQDPFPKRDYRQVLHGCLDSCRRRCQYVNRHHLQQVVLQSAFAILFVWRELVRNLISAKTRECSCEVTNSGKHTHTHMSMLKLAVVEFIGVMARIIGIIRP